MSNSKSKLIKPTMLPNSWPCFADDRQQSVRPLSGKWSDPEYLARLEQERLIRESQKLGMQTASDVESGPKVWIFPDWLQQDELTALVGPPKAGKTTFACALAAGVTRGKGFSLAPGLTPIGSGHVIIVNKEDNIATAVIPRLKAAGADLDKVHFIGCNAGHGDSSFSFFSERDLARLEGAAQGLDNNLGLIIIDPIYCVVDGDQNNEAKAREAYEGLRWLAQRLTCAILGIAHTVRNPRSKDPLNRVAGPPALRHVPRAVMLLSKISNGPTATGGTHVLVHAKNNEGKQDGGFEYRHMPIDIPGQHGSNGTTKIVITAELTGSAEEILNQADSALPLVALSKRDVAVKFLRDVLQDGPRLWIDVKNMAEEVGISNGTLQNAKIFVKIVTKKREGDGRSVWRLPDAEVADYPVDSSK